MAWRKQTSGGWGDTPLHTSWYNDQTGEYSDFDPTPSGQFTTTGSFNDGSYTQQVVDSVTGRPATAAEVQSYEQQQAQQKEADFMALWNDPNASSWDKARAVHLNYGIETLAQLANQGHFADVPELGGYIAARQREAESEGFSINGNQLGNWPTIIGTMGFAALAGAGAAGAGAGAGEGAATGATAAEGATAGVSAGAGGEFTGGLTGTAAGSPGLSAGTFNASSLGAGGAATAPGVVAPSAGLTGAGALTAGSFAGESLVPVLGGMSAATGATGLGSASAGASAAGTAAGATGLSRLLDGAGTASDWLDLAGRLGPAALGAFASNEQSKDLAALGDKYFSVGAPSRARYEASFAPGFNMNMDPGYKDALDQTTKSFLHKASVTGNPVDSPNAWQQTLKDVNSSFAYPALNEYRRLNAGSGGLASLTAAAPGAATSAINAERGIYDAIGAGAADIFTPRKSLADLLREARAY